MTERSRPARRNLRGKQRVRGWLASEDLDAVARAARDEGHGRVARQLMYLLFDRDETIRGRAGTALGRVAAVTARDHPDDVRELIRRVLWWMNDESGALLWSGPEVLAAVLEAVPELRGEYAHILPSFLTEPPFERGAHWAVARLAACAPELMTAARGALVRSLEDPDAATRALAGAALRSLGSDAPGLGALADDPTPVRIYDPDRLALVDTTVGEVVSGA